MTSTDRGGAPRHDQRRRTGPATGSCARPRAGPWSASRESVGTFLFLVPMLVIFGVFSWLPIVRAVVMSVQDTNLVSDPVFVGLDNFVRVWNDPLFWTAIRNTLWFALLALVFGYPIPLILAVLMSTVRRRRGLYSALAYLPVVVPPVVAVLLWKFFYDGSPTGVFNTILGWFGVESQPWLQSAATRDALAGPRGHLGQRGRPRSSSISRRWSRCPSELYDAAEVDGAGLLRKVLARHAAPAAGRAAGDAHPPDHRHRPGVPRAVPVHGRRPGERDHDRAAAHLQVRVPEQRGRRLRRGDRAVSLMLALFLAVFSADLLPAHPVVGQLMTATR